MKGNSQMKENQNFTCWLLPNHLDSLPRTKKRCLSSESRRSTLLLVSHAWLRIHFLTLPCMRWQEMTSTYPPFQLLKQSYYQEIRAGMVTAWRFLQHDHIILFQAVGGIVSPSQVTLKQDRKDLAGETRIVTHLSFSQLVSHGMSFSSNRCYTSMNAFTWQFISPSQWTFPFSFF